ncbi:hypothetical protein BDP27DRAFT_1314952 [Rhodocollybia butyracea]|uniref:R3H domain-containing protein n=1 Tax=Rhodocollybia butyracea TaxID=206335 RepID=A0A9P5UDQ0_9AGAR|nr:hypothetical protein BDP27DRAFT_1314952 [Rhodocollybia butyracea]
MSRYTRGCRMEISSSAHTSEAALPSTSDSTHNRRPRRTNNRPKKPNEPDSGDNPNKNDSQPAQGSLKKPRNRPNQRRNQTRVDGDHTDKKPEGKADGPAKPARLGKAKFNAGLTAQPSTQDSASGSGKSRRYGRQKKNLPTEAGDLTTNLIRELSQPPYLDCLICFSAIHPPQPIWSCSPLIPIQEDDSGHQPQYCWSTFHLKCIRDWAEKSYKEDGEWRCPGCQGRRNKLIKGYACFCGSTRSPNNHLATPHSCGNACSRPRTGCSHHCPLLCHPGPCPPCKVIMDVRCNCIRQQAVSVRCGENPQVSCGQMCSKVLGCGKHYCQDVCHDEKSVMCGEGDVWLESVGCDELSTDHMLEPRKGFGCESVCDNLFDCGEHSCVKSCHPPTSGSIAGHCPMSPDRVTTCPCGKRQIAISSSPQGDEFPARTKCTEPIPTCDSTCLKSHSDCEHPCQAKCHTSPLCPPCQVNVVRPCRCGSTTKTLRCGDLRVLDKESGLMKEQEILCDRPCPASRSCGKHRCNRICCPLASVAATAKAKGKNRAIAAQFDADPDGLHECELVCGKMLSCGNHQCEERDHRGPCKPCLRSSFEELICFCGRTVLEPPIPCGTQIHCNYPCSLPPPSCGHPKTPHSCHFTDSECPPCVFLTEKLCACGKKTIPNIKCSLDSDKVSCGLVCGKLMPCGWHKCDRQCHSGECGTCTSMCGKARKLCLPEHHPCTDLCHAPTGCNEDHPCQSRVELTCECGRIRQAIACGISRGQPAGSAKGQVIKCTTECALKKRNARLADALGIKPGGGAAEVTYSDELVSFARVNSKFLTLVEDALAEFVKSSRTKQVLPHMPPEKRNFVYKLANLYRLDSQMVDQDPHRSVQIIRRIDTRIPNPVLSAFITSKSTASSATSLGKLVNLRGPAVANPVGGRLTPSPGPGSATARGWNSAAAAGPSRSVVSATIPPKSTPSPVGGTISRPRTPAPSKPDAIEGANKGVETPQEDIPDNWEDDT